MIITEKNKLNKIEVLAMVIFDIRYNYDAMLCSGSMRW